MLPSAPPPAADELPQHSNGNGSNTLEDTCNELASKVNAFLDTEAPTDVLRDVQKQTRIAIDVIHEALERYKSV